MSRQNIEIVREAYAAWERDGIDGVIPFVDAEVQFRNPPDAPEAGVYFGHDGIRDWFAKSNEVIGDVHFDVDRIEELPDRRLLAILRGHVKGRGSGIEMEVPFAHVIEMQAGKVTAFTMYTNIDDALDDVGLAQ